MEVSRSLRTSLPLAAICARLEAQFGWPPFVIDADVARLTVDDLRLELEWVPFDPRRELRANVIATLSDEGRGFARRWDDALDAMNEPARFRFEDHYYLRSALAIDAFVAALQQPFQLPELHHDCENDNEWCMVETDDVVVHVSHAYRLGTYHEWQPKRCPPRCNYWIEVMVKAAAPAALDQAWRVGWRQRWIEALQELGRGQVHIDGVWHRRRRSLGR